MLLVQVGVCVGLGIVPQNNLHHAYGHRIFSSPEHPHRKFATGKKRFHENRLSVLTDELAATVKARDELSSRLQDMSAQADTTAAESERLRALLAENKQDRERLTGALQASREETEQQQELTEQAQTRVNELNVQIVALREQLLKLTQALETSEAKVKDQTIEIENLGRRLNVALADKVEELAGYRSEFFGKLREALKENPDIRVEGDRFVLPSEVLFASASADLDAEGKREIAMVARTLKEISAKIPKDLDWVLRVDGHTDKRPIRVAFPSNWELSSARALSIVKYMIDQGIPADHLVAAGFGQYHPIDPAETADAYRRNRRIELKLTSR